MSDWQSTSAYNEEDTESCLDSVCKTLLKQRGVARKIQQEVTQCKSVMNLLKADADVFQFTAGEVIRIAEEIAVATKQAHRT